MKKQNGITLIALIITIIVMMILVGVTVAVVMQGGLFDKATIAVIKQETATMQEYIVTKGADMLADKAKDGDELNVTVEEILQAYGMTLTEINFEETPDYISNVDVDPAGTCYLLDASKLHVDSSRGNGTAQIGKDIFVVDSNKRVYYIIESGIEIKEPEGFAWKEVDEGEIPAYDIAKIYAIEDLVKLSEMVNAGTFEEEYRKVYGEDAEIIVTLERTLDFTNPSSYREADDTTRGDINGIEDGNAIITEMMPKIIEEDNGAETKTGLGFKPIGGMDLQTQEIKSFKGTFEGKYNTIYNLYINRPEEMIAGLFGVIDSETTIQNLGLTGYVNAGIEGYGGMIGVLMPNSSSTQIDINNFHIDEATVEVAGGSGGIGVIISEYDTAKISITNCSIGEESLIQGGVVSGLCTSVGKTTLTVQECTNLGKISSPGGAFASGLVTSMQTQGDVIIQDCINYGSVECSGERPSAAGVAVATGGVNAYEYSEGCVTINRCFNNGIVKTLETDKSSVWYDDTRTSGVCIIVAMSLNMQDCENNGTIESSTYYTSGVGCCLAIENNISNCKNNTDILINDDLPMVSGVIFSGGKLSADADDFLTCNTLENNGKIIANLKEDSTKVQIEYVAGCLISYKDDFTDNSKLVINNCINNGEINLSNAEPSEIVEVDGIVIANGQAIVEKTECVNNANVITPTN